MLLLPLAALAAEPPAESREVPPASTDPVVIEDAVLRFPESAIAMGVTGTVILRLTVDERGLVVAKEVVQGVRPDLDSEALAAASRLRFRPATRDGLPVPATLDYAFSFTLDVRDQQGNRVPGSVRLTLVDPDGLAVPGATLTLRLPDGTTRTATATDDGLAAVSFLPPGEWTLDITRPGFVPTSTKVAVLSGETREATLTLLPAGATESVVVIGLRQRWREVERAPREPVYAPVTGLYQLTRRDVESTPGALEDVTRAVHKLPGVASDSDLLGTFSVRGATSSEVAFLLDGVPLDNPYHLAGFNSIFNPDMLKKVDFYAGAPPSRYPDTTSAVMAVTSWDGAGKDDRRDLDGAVDISMQSARLLALGPLGKEGTPGDPTFAFAARRSYIEAYFAVMKAANLFDTAVAAPEFDELSGRLAWSPGDHHLLITALRTSDHLALLDSDDESLITIDGAFALDDALYLAAVQDRWTPGPVDGVFRGLDTVVAYTFDQSHMERSIGGTVETDAARHQGFASSEATLSVPHVGELAVGASATLRAYDLAGPVEDTRLDPTWVAAPIADRGFSLVELSPQPAGGTEAAWAQIEGHAQIRPRAGVRVTRVDRTRELLVSPSAGVSVPLPTATIPKLTGGLYHHVVEDPLVVDPVYGNPDLRAERAWQLVAGVDQGLPLGKGGLLRVEAYYAALDRLVVNYDATAPTDALPYQNLGTGHNAGVDTMLALSGERWQLAANASYLHARRTNPLNVVYPSTIPPAQAQAWTAGLSAEWQATQRWRFTTRYDFHTGRPISSVAAAGDDTVALTGLNDEQLGDFHQVDLRAEWRKATPKLRWSVYLEVLNALYFRSDFLPIVSVEEGVMNTTMLSHLPTRPFLGVRADF